MNDGQPHEVNLPMEIMSEQSLAVDLARAEIDQAIATAHRYPRVLQTVIQKIETMACYNEAAAENCIYSLPRGGKPIIGASIGFANIVAQAWGNCTDGARIVFIDRKEKTVVAEGGFHDLESNRKTVLPVQRRIADKQGRIFSDDMIMVTGMAAASIARRNAILNAVPRALWFPIYERALQIVRGGIETFAERKSKALAAFAQFGIKPDQVIAALGLKGEADLTLEHIPPMRGMYSALRDGSLTVEELLDPRRMAGAGFEKVDNPLGEEGATAETVDAKTGEVKPARGRPRKKKEEPPPEGTIQVVPGKPVGGPGLAATPITLTAAGLGATVTPAIKAGEIKPAPEAPIQAENARKAADIQQTQAVAEVNHLKAQHDGVKAAQAPRNVAEYHRHLKIWLAACTSVKEVEDRWIGERVLRGNCSVIGEDFDSAMDIRNKRIADLGGK
jgi:hypothetical protein